MRNNTKNAIAKFWGKSVVFLAFCADSLIYHKSVIIIILKMHKRLAATDSDRILIPTL